MGGEKYPQIQQRISLEPQNRVRSCKEIDVKYIQVFYNSKCFLKRLYLCVFFFKLKNKILIKKSNVLRFAKHVFHTSHATFLLD